MIKQKSKGVPLMGPTYVYCDYQMVVNNKSVTKSTLNKKHNSNNYHVVHKAAAVGILGVGKEYTATNVADPLMNLMPYSRRNYLLGYIY